MRWTSSSFVPEEEILRFLQIVCSSGALSWGEGRLEGKKRKEKKRKEKKRKEKKRKEKKRKEKQKILQTFFNLVFEYSPSFEPPETGVGFPLPGIA